MRLYSFDAGGVRRFGVETEDGRLMDLLAAQREIPFEDKPLERMVDFIAAGEEALIWAQGLIARASAPTFAPEDVTFGPPLRRPQKIVCIGQNYMDHCREQGKEPPPNPIFFPKYPNCLIGTGEAVVLPEISEQVDYEGELAVVIGKRGKKIPGEHALSHVFGYTIMNDISARDVQFGDKQWARGKTCDTFAPLGPCLVTADEIPDPQSLKIRTLLNGDVMQDSTTAEMIFPVKHIVSFLSRAITFEPGDIISTGTPHGVGVWRDPKVFLKAGDAVRVEIEKIGALENPIESE